MLSLSFSGPRSAGCEHLHVALICVALVREHLSANGAQ
eukprot:COSAG02_NODE_39517_length_416_cov_0.804416_1_plen_37_part_10